MSPSAVSLVAVELDWIRTKLHRHWNAKQILNTRAMSTTIIFFFWQIHFLFLELVSYSNYHKTYCKYHTLPLYRNFFSYIQINRTFDRNSKFVYSDMQHKMQLNIKKNYRRFKNTYSFLKNKIHKIIAEIN